MCLGQLVFIVSSRSTFLTQYCLYKQVAFLYRKSLKTLLSWAVDRDIFNEKATELRARFDANRGVDSHKAAKLLRVSASCSSFVIIIAVIHYSRRESNLTSRVSRCIHTFCLLFQDGEDELFSWTHPDMYVIPYMPGGSKFMRNPPLPMSVCFPDGNLPADAPKYEVNPDMSYSKPETGKNAVGTVLVDFYKKNME